MTRTRAVVSLLAVVVAGPACTFGDDPVGTPTPLATAPRTVTLVEPSHAATTAGTTRGPVTPSARARQGTTLLHGPVDGRGPTDLGALRVPARYEVVTSCVGPGTFGLTVDGRVVGQGDCAAEGESGRDVVDRAPGSTTARLRVVAGSGVRWSVLVTTPGG